MNRFVLTLVLLSACGDDDSSSAPAVEAPAPPTPREVVEDPPEAEMRPLAPLPASRIVTRGPYQADAGRDCDGYPALALSTSPGLCVGVVATSEDPSIASAGGKFRPRTLTTDPADPDTMWVVDAGARRDHAGQLWRFRRTDAGWTGEVILRRSNRPHGSAIGPDGRLYVGEMNRIVAVDPAASDAASSLEVVIDELPVVGHERAIRFHPMRAFVFAPNGDLISNMGSATDRCLESRSQARCHDEADRTAAIWRFPREGDGWGAPEVLARGLRNSMALAMHASGTLLQAENGADFAEDDRPHEELNVIVAGKHYGWPYCYDRGERDPAWTHAEFDCAGSDHTPPHLLLPPHGAPLGMHYYGGALPALDGSLLIVLHGYRAAGHRVLGFEVDARGLPAGDAEPRQVISGWDASDTGPRGTPVDLAVAHDGSVWIAEDNNGTILRLAVDEWAGRRSGESDAVEVVLADAVTAALVDEILRPRCSRCHEHLRGDANAALMGMRQQGWLRSTVLSERLGPDAERPMPPDTPLPEDERARVLAWARSVAR